MSRQPIASSQYETGYHMIAGNPDAPRVLPMEPSRLVTRLALLSQLDPNLLGGEANAQEELFMELDRALKAGELPEEWLPHLAEAMEAYRHTQDSIS